MPGARVFVDTNILVYSREIDKDPRIEISRRWLDELAHAGALVLNLQVLNELTHVLFRKRQGLDTAEIFDAVDQLVGFGQRPVGMATMLLSRVLKTTTRYPWWDCLLLASALELSCTHFLSEDLHDGHVVEGPDGRTLTIVDPFTHTPDQILTST